MYKRIAVFTLVAFIVLSFSSLVMAADHQKEIKKDEKMEMTKSEKEMGPVKSVSCAPECGFVVKSRNEAEVISFTKKHAKEMHHKKLTDTQVKEMIKTE
jgi:predicted small metal-binding protein